MLATIGIIQSNSKGLPYTPPLDTYTGAAAAYSLRKLRTAYSGSAIRVRRSSDNLEQDIGFDGYGNLNESALTSFVGANSGYVTKWYDQSWNARDAAQTTSANQPRIVNAGTVDKINNKCAIFFDGTNDRLTISSSTTTFKFLHDGTKWMNNNVLYANTATANALYGNNRGTTANVGIFLDRPNNKWVATTISASGGVSFAPVSYNTTSNSFADNVQRLLTIIGDPSNATASNRLYVYINQTQYSGNTNTASPNTSAATYDFDFGSYGNGIGTMNGYWQEAIFYSSDQSSNRTGIESNINSYYSIY